MSTAYADARYPAHKSFASVQSELARRVQGRVLRLLRPSNLSAYLSAILAKRRAGRPVAFTDFFALMLGETLLPDVRHSLLPIICTYVLSANVHCPSLAAC